MQAQDDAADDFEPELILPEHFLPANPFPRDAQRLGIDRFTGDSGALIALAASLDGRKPLHRVFAWMLLVLVVGSFVLTLWNELT